MEENLSSMTANPKPSGITGWINEIGLVSMADTHLFGPNLSVSLEMTTAREPVVVEVTGSIQNSWFSPLGSA
jgi:hypothetical protein